MNPVNLVLVGFENFKLGAPLIRMIFYMYSTVQQNLPMHIFTN